MSNISKRRRDGTSYAFKGLDHGQFLNRITKTLYYGKLPPTERLSLPMSELAAELFSEAHRGHSLQRLHVDNAADITRSACVSPCALVLAMLYLDRLKDCDPDYVRRVAPSELFLVSLMVSSKFLHDDGAEDEVFLDEWATSGGLTTQQLKQMEREFLHAIEWKIFISEKTFWSELSSLEESLAWRQGNKRGWYSYRELALFLPSIDLAKVVVYITGILALGYTAGVLSIVGAFYITSQIPGSALRSTTVSSSLSPIQNVTTNENIVEGEDLVDDTIEITDIDFESILHTFNETESLSYPSITNTVYNSSTFTYWFDMKPMREFINRKNYYPNIPISWPSLVF